LRPAFAAFIFYGVIVFTIRKEKIIKYKFIKIFGSVFAQFFYFFSIIRITITKGLKTVGFANS